MASKKNIERAMVAAADYARESKRGDVVRAEQIARTIDELVGYRNRAGKFAIPVAVRRVMDAR